MDKIGIIILNWNWYSDTIECIDSLLLNSYTNKELIIIDNNSMNDEGKQIKNKYKSKITFIQNNKNLGFTWWCNVWIKKALDLKCDYVMLFNNDAVAKDGFIEKLLHTFNSFPKVWIVGPAITYYWNNKIWFRGWKINYILWTPIHNNKWKDIWEYNELEIIETEYVSWCCMLIKKELFEKNWLLDEHYFAYYEEVDFCFQAKKNWYLSLINTASVIEHKKSASAWNKGSNYLSNTQAYLMARNWVYFWKKNLSGYKKHWFIITQYTILPVLRCAFQIRNRSVLKYYILWLINKKWIIK